MPDQPKTQTKKKTTPDGGDLPTWPVAQGSDLTVDHIPQKLRDEIERPWRQRCATLSRELLDVMDRRNDLVAGIARLEKEGAKDSNQINKDLGSPQLMEALQASGVAVRGNGGGRQ